MYYIYIYIYYIFIIDTDDIKMMSGNASRFLQGLPSLDP